MGRNKLQQKYILPCVLYRPPSANDSYFNDILDMIEKATVKGQDCILLGDLNYDYDINESLHKNPIHYIESLYEMTQLITEKNESHGMFGNFAWCHLDHEPRTTQSFQCGQKAVERSLHDLYWVNISQ